MRLLALVEAPDHVCCRRRLRAFEPALSRAGCSLTIESLERGALRRIIQFARLEPYDAVLLQRLLMPAWQLRRLRKASRRLIFDFDDAILHNDSYCPRGVASPKRARRFAATVRLADVVIAGNDYLAECALKAGARRGSVTMVPTCVGAADFATAERGPDRGGLELVWIGSSSTLQGLERRRGLWERLGREVPNLKLRAICDRFPDFGPLPIIPIQWSERTEAQEVAAGDVGINWMPDDLWSRGKCGLKILQYQAAALPVVANPVGVHREMIEPGVSGFLPRSDTEWLEAIGRLAAEPALRRRMGNAGRAAAEANYSVSVWSSRFVSAVFAKTGDGGSWPRHPGE